MGNAAPCKSHQSLQVFTEFKEIEQILPKCKTNPEIAAIHKRFEPFESALTDLVTMAKAADRRLALAITKADEAIKKRLDLRRPLLV